MHLPHLVPRSWEKEVNKEAQQTENSEFNHIPTGLSRLSSRLYEQSSSSIRDLQQLVLVTPSWSL